MVTVAAALLVACSPSDSPVPSGTTTTASPVAVDVCPEIHLLMPNGEPLDLSGRWLANDAGSYFLTQSDSCMFWMGQSPPGEDYPAGAAWTNVFSGRIVSSFEVAGPWSDVPAVAGGSADRGELHLGIEFFDLDGVTWPRLVMQSQVPPSFGGTAWQPEVTVAEAQSFTGTYGRDVNPTGSHGFDPGCPWLDVNGQRYTLVANLNIEGQHIFSQDGRPVMEGALAHVEGQVAPALGYPGCPPNALLVSDLYPAP